MINMNIQSLSKNGVKLGRPRLGEESSNSQRAAYMRSYVAQKKAENPNYLAERNAYQKQWNAEHPHRLKSIQKGTQLRKKIRADLAAEFFKTDI
jgi:hypothetical protein